MVDIYCHAEFHNTIVAKMRKAFVSTKSIDDILRLKAEVLNHECRSRCFSIK